MSIVDQAERFVEHHARDLFRKAFIKVEKERHGNGCGCPACKKNAVAEINSIAHFLAGEQDIPEYEIDESGEIDLR